ncbi:MAG: FAS1-like dehydratase domain-containing protein [Candidatus Binatia bacterium]
MQEVEYGKITEEGLAKIRARIGAGFDNRRPWRTEVTVDAIYHLALAIGDLSPLYIDEEYAKKTRWGTLIAPPIMIQCFDTLRAVGSAGLPEGLPGVHSIWSGSMYELERPLKLGDKVRSKSYLKEVRDAESSFAGGRTVFQTYEAVYWNQHDEKLGVRQDTWIRNERNKTKKTGKYGETELATWTLDQIHDLWKSYEEEERTVARKWADVKVGDELKPILKGPLTPTAEIAFESYFGVYLVGNKVAANLYKRHPKLMIPNEQGVPEPPQRVHWDNQFTKNLLGLPGAYDLGPERCAWLTQGATNWMGDDGYVRKIEAQYRKFNYMGDVTWIKGKVADKKQDGDKKIATLEVWCENHRDEMTAKARIEVVLP